MNRHKWNKVLEGLRCLVMRKKRELQSLPQEKLMQRKTLGQEIQDINELIHEIKDKYIWSV